MKLPQQFLGIGGSENNYLRKVEILEGNVGYIQLSKIPALATAQQIVDAAFTLINNTDALILDVRSNRGGVGGFIPYFMSYLFPSDSMLLYRREMTAWDSISYHHTYKQLAGPRFDKPVFVLIDAGTGSAATNLAYTLQSFERATLVGENTGSGYRGAHSASPFALAGGFVGIVPIGRVVNAKTGTNWRAAGVNPDIESSSEEALIRAHIASLKELTDRTTTSETKQKLIEISESLKVQRNETSAAKNNEEYTALVGTYEGDRTIFVGENKNLYLQRKGGSPIQLVTVSENLFRMKLKNPDAANNLPNVRFLQENSTVMGIEFVFKNGSTQGPYKKEE